MWQLDTATMSPVWQAVRDIAKMFLQLVLKAGLQGSNNLESGAFVTNPGHKKAGLDQAASSYQCE